MTLLVCGVVLGFVMSYFVFTRKIWELQDRLTDERRKVKFYRRKLSEKSKQLAEWETVTKCGSSRSLEKF